ncbi:M23 family metallopeptidase [Cruoricaptor ignavus]|nr:M23 family metallopeptidase [Cruoricaptor ignavus]
MKHNSEYHQAEMNREEKGLSNPTLKKIWKNLFVSDNNEKLKSEIDSLKNKMTEFEKSSRRKENYQKIKDSIWLQMQLQWRQNTAGPPIPTETTASAKEMRALSERISLPLKNSMSISSPFGFRLHPIFGIRKMHNGMDIKANYEKVYSVLDGVVSAAGWDPKGGGNYIKINHFNRFETAYLHLSEMYYKVGERVRAGFIIGRSGNSGNSTGPHLHFAVKEYGRLINPDHFLKELMNIKHLNINKNTL